MGRCGINILRRWSDGDQISEMNGGEGDAQSGGLPGEALYPDGDVWTVQHAAEQAVRHVHAGE